MTMKFLFTVIAVLMVLDSFGICASKDFPAPKRALIEDPTAKAAIANVREVFGVKKFNDGM